MRKLSRRERALLGLMAAVVAALGVWAVRHPESAPVALSRSKPEAPLPAVPRIDLARLDVKHAHDEAGRRDLFDYGPLTEPDETGVVATALPTPPANPAPIVPSGPVIPSLPSLNLKYIGSVENAAGIKVAVLLTDRREVLTGQAGQVVANRYRISRIGLESVDLEDVNSGQSRRIPLRGN